METKIYAIANQKGGVGKTTTALNLSVALSKKGYKVLGIDFDPQSNFSTYAGFNSSEDNEPTMSEILLGQVTGSPVAVTERTIRHSDKNQIDYIPSDINLSTAEMYLLNAIARETVLQRILDSQKIKEYDYVIIDCSPHLDILLMNALSACHKVIIPVEVQDFALDGLTALDEVVKQIKTSINPQLEILGVLATMYEENTIASRDNYNILIKRYGNKVFRTLIHRGIQATYSVRDRISLCLLKGRLGEEYMSLADEVLSLNGVNNE